MMNINKEFLGKIVSPLLEWYDLNKRDLPWRHNPTPYRVWISEIMLQQTRVEPVIPYYLRFMETFPDVEALATAAEDDLMKHWEGLGYYSRARNLQKAAKIIAEAGEYPKDFNGWLKLPGIGNYTAGAICSIALGMPTPAVDGNVLRVLSRILGSYEDIAAEYVKKEFTAALKEVYPEGKTSEFTQALMELGATVCLPNGAPLCQSCPLSSLCRAFNENLTESIPVKAPKKKRKIEERTILILRSKNMVALNQRPEKGLLAKMWEFPNIEGHLNENAIKDMFGEDNISFVSPIGSSTHIFSHIEWHMNGFLVELNDENDQFNWVTTQELIDKIAIPSAYRYYLDYLKEIRYKEI